MNTIDKKLYGQLLAGIRRGIMESFDFQADNIDDDTDDGLLADEISYGLTSPLNVLAEEGIQINDPNTTVAEVEPFTTADGITHRVIEVAKESGYGSIFGGANFVTINVGAKERSGKYYTSSAIHWKNISAAKDPELYNDIIYIREHSNKFGIDKQVLSSNPYKIGITVDKQILMFDNYKPDSQSRRYGFKKYFAFVGAGSKASAGNKEAAQAYVDEFMSHAADYKQALAEQTKAYNDYQQKKSKADGIKHQMSMMPYTFFKNREDCKREDVMSDIECRRYNDNPVELVKYIAKKFGLKTPME